MKSIARLSILPKSNRIDAGKLACIFNKTTTSYKYLFFQSILKILHEDGFYSNPIDFYRLGHEMLVIAWYPHTYYRLSFGSQDQLYKQLNAINADRESRSIVELKRAVQENSKSCYNIMRFVPYRLLSVFFEDKLRGIKDCKKNQIIRDLSVTEFDRCMPIYKFVSPDAIELHENWLGYLYENYSIVESWALWQWLDYLQRRNPNVPAISKKLFSPPVRQSLRKEIEYWKAVSTRMDVGCIYTNDMIQEDDLSLDHFLPWSFVGHDRLWNLIPVSKSINSSKGNRIPDVATYIDGLVKLQHSGLVCAKEVMSERVWKDRAECFIADLNVPDYASLLDINILKSKYHETVYPLAQLAANTGFNCNWLASQKSAEIVELRSRHDMGNIIYQEVPYFSDIRIACGYFKTGSADAKNTAKIPSSYHTDVSRHFIARATGNSMNGGKNPIVDGDYLLLESVSPERAGSITDKIMVVERQDVAGDNQFVLRVVRKRGINDYYLQAQNPDYEDFDATEEMRTLARLLAVVPKNEILF